MSDLILTGETINKRGRTRYYQQTQPTDIFNQQNNQPQAQTPNFNFLFSPESINEYITKRQKERDEFNENYLINLDDKQYDMLRPLLANSENPEEQIYKFATAIQYAQHFNMGVDVAYQNLDLINKQWLGEGKAPYKTTFKAVADSFAIGANTLNIAHLGNKLMIAEKTGNKQEADKILQKLKEAEDKNLDYQDKMPRSWVTNLLKAGANTIPFSASVLLPSIAASTLNPLLGAAVGFGTSATIQNGLEYWELRKAGVKREYAENLAMLSGGLQALIETALGNVAGVLAKGFKVNTVTSGILKKLNAQRVISRAGKILLNYGTEMFEEGVEEALQELVSAGTKATAAVLQGEGVETDDAWTIAGNVWESFKGGITGSIVLGIPGVVIDGKRQKAEATNTSFYLHCVFR